MLGSSQFLSFSSHSSVSNFEGGRFSSSRFGSSGFGNSSFGPSGTLLLASRLSGIPNLLFGGLLRVGSATLGGWLTFGETALSFGVRAIDSALGSNGFGQAAFGGNPGFGLDGFAWDSGRYPCSSPALNSPFVSFGTTPTHSAWSSTGRGIWLEFGICCNVCVALLNSSPADRTRPTLGEGSRLVKLNCLVEGQRKTGPLLGLLSHPQEKVCIRTRQYTYLARQNRSFEGTATPEGENARLDGGASWIRTCG